MRDFWFISEKLDPLNKIELYGVLLTSILALVGLYNYIEGGNDKLKITNNKPTEITPK